MTIPQTTPRFRTHLKPQILVCAAALVVVLGMVIWLWPQVAGTVRAGVVASAAIAAIALVYAGWEAWQISVKGAIEQKLRSTVSQMKASWDDAPLSVILFDPHDPDIPVNDGFYRLIDIRSRPGSVVHAQHPAAVAAGWEIAADGLKIVP